MSKSQYQYVLQSGDTPKPLYRLAPDMRDKIAKVPGLLDVTTDLYIKNPQMTVDIDREEGCGPTASSPSIRCAISFINA